MTKPVGIELDRRVAKTRRALHQAFIQVVLEKGWEATRIQDICERADVGRTTFYAHFADKDELLSGSLADFAVMLRESAPSRNPADPLWFVSGVIRHAIATPELFKALLGKLSGTGIQMRFRQFLAGLARESLSRKGLPQWRTDFVSHYLAGAIQESISWWLDAKNPLDPAGLEAAIRAWSQSAIASLD